MIFFECAPCISYNIGWLSLFKRLWRFKYMRQATMVELEQTYNRIFRRLWRTGLMPLEPDMGDAAQVALKAAPDSIWTRDYILTHNNRLIQQASQKYQQWRQRRERIIPWLDRTAQKLWGDMCDAVNKTHRDESVKETKVVKGTSTSSATNSGNTAPVAAGTSVSFVPLNKHEPNYIKLEQKFGSESSEVKEAIAAIDNAILPTKLPFTILAQEFGTIYHVNFFVSLHSYL
jgi:hypothetical protein